MKFSYPPLLLVGLLVVLAACSKADPKNSADDAGRVYTSDAIGWRMEVPEGWELVTEKDSEDLMEKGREAIEESTGQVVDATGLRNLLSFRKGKTNIFQSTMEPFEEAFEGEWAENNVALRELILQTYRDQGLEAKASEIESEEIGGLVFQKLTIELALGNGGVLRQVMYSRMINGFDFGANLSYTDEESGREMAEAWRNSEFGL